MEALHILFFVELVPVPVFDLKSTFLLGCYVQGVRQREREASNTVVRT